MVITVMHEADLTIRRAALQYAEIFSLKSGLIRPCKSGMTLIMDYTSNTQPHASRLAQQS